MAGGRVLDSWAVICYLAREPGFEEVAELLAEAVMAGHKMRLSVVNWGEVLYIAQRRKGRSGVRTIETAIDGLPIDLVPVDKDTARQAAQVKAGGGLSYADAFAVALARLAGVDLVTGDPEMAAAEKFVKVRWLVKR
ncbi:MAG: type II toxin-antitoxin system VapC family toxin [Acidobacteriota bacterium]